MSAIMFSWGLRQNTSSFSRNLSLHPTAFKRNNVFLPVGLAQSRHAPSRRAELERHVQHRTTPSQRTTISGSRKAGSLQHRTAQRTTWVKWYAIRTSGTCSTKTWEVVALVGQQKLNSQNRQETRRTGFGPGTRRHDQANLR